MSIPSIEESRDEDDAKRAIPETSPLEEKKGKLSKNKDDEDKLMHSVLEDDGGKISDGRLISESVTQGLGSLTPDMIFQNMVKDFKLAKKLYGETIIRELTGYSPNYIDNNIKIPEFKRELQKKINDKIQGLKDEGLLGANGEVTDRGFTLAALVLYVEELDHLVPKGFGERETKKKTPFGEKYEYKNFNKDRYRDIAIKRSIKTALRRGHTELSKGDLKAFDNKSVGKVSIIYGIDASGSMKGEKLKIAKKAGIALAFKAINDRNKVGLVIFGSEVKEYIEPTLDFMMILKKLADIRASNETDIAKGITKSCELFKKGDTKHLVLLTDAMPTKGVIPENETITSASIARDDKITISIIGIGLDDKGEELAKKIIEVGNGKLYKVTDLQNVDKIILEDYDSIKNG